jgi:ABC-type glycerol-3-phosphate transport system substrate-binding protein
MSIGRRDLLILGGSTLAMLGASAAAPSEAPQTKQPLDAIVAQLQASNITVEIDPEKYPNGRFARLHDPDGNPIELWEPAGT